MNDPFDYKEYIYAVYKERSFSKAAAALHTSQPWLSAKVKEVERELGAPLFDRSTSPLTVTEAGEFYVRQAEKVMQTEAELSRYFEQLRTFEAGNFRIGSSMYFCTYVLPSLLADFHREHPGVTLTFEEGATSVLTEKLLSGELDMVLEAERPEQKQLTCLPWETEEIVLGVPAGYPVNRQLSEYCYSFDELLKRDLPGRKKPPVPLSYFSNQPFLMLDETNDIHRRGMEICRRAGFEPPVKLQLTQMMTAYYLVCEGHGVSFLRASIPEYVTPTESIVFYQLDDPDAMRTIYLSYLTRNMTPQKRFFLDYITKKHA